MNKCISMSIYTPDKQPSLTLQRPPPHHHLPRETGRRSRTSSRASPNLPWPLIPFFAANLPFWPCTTRRMAGMQEGGEMQALLSILAEGEEQARRLLLQDGDGRECCRAVAGQLGRTIGKAMAAAKAIQAARGAASASAGTDERSGSPRSADESSAAQPQVLQERQGVCKRRKGLPRWTEKFRIPDTNLEYTPDDGFSWRKYGQKDILGAKFPRGYYRCTYRTAQGCPAIRQVQRSDADFAVLDVTYQGAHTCRQINHRHPVPVPQPPPSAPAHGGIHPDLQLLATFKDGLKVETTDHGPSPSASSFQIHGLHHHGASFPYAAGAAGFPSSSPGFVVSPGPATAPAAAGGSGYFSSAAAGSELGEVVSAATSSAPANPAGFEHYPLFQYDYDPLQEDDLDPDLQFPAMFGHPSASSSSPGQHNRDA